MLFAVIDLGFDFKPKTVNFFITSIFSSSIQVPARSKSNENYHDFSQIEHEKGRKEGILQNSRMCLISLLFNAICIIVR